MLENHFEAGDSGKSAAQPSAFHDEFAQLQKSSLTGDNGFSRNNTARSSVRPEFIDFKGDIRTAETFERVQQMMIPLPPPRDNSEVVKALKETIKAFNSEPDKKSAIGEYTPKFEKHIADADDAAKKVNTTAIADLQKLEPGRTEVREKVREDYLAVTKSINALSEEHRREAFETAQAYLNIPNKKIKEQAFQALKEGSPEVAEAAKKLNDDMENHKDVFDADKNSLKAVEGAARDQLYTRIMFAKALSQAGENGKSQSMSKDAVESYKAVYDQYVKASTGLFAPPEQEEQPGPETRDVMWHTLELKTPY